MAISYNFIFAGTEQFGSAVNVCVCIRQFPALDIGRVMAIMNESGKFRGSTSILPGLFHFKHFPIHYSPFRLRSPV
jgi:membrane protease subunit (stomatin/prohibitin family)